MKSEKKSEKKTETDPDHFRITQHRGATYVRMPLIAFIGGLLTLIVMIILFWSVKRDNGTILRVEQPGELGALLPSIAGLTHSVLEDGNNVEVLQNGDAFFPPLLRDIAAARKSVHVENFIWYDGKLATELANLLAKKAREGVQVRLLVDGSGGRQLDGEEREMLDAAGVKVAHFHPFRLSNLGRLNNRDHRKLMVIDGTIGYVGGFCIADEWLGNAQDKKHFRDTGLRVVGPVVNRLQAVFAENWIEETGEVMAGDDFFPKPQPAGTSTAHVAYTSPDGGVSAVQLLYYMAIKAARKEILIQNPYLLPEDEAIEALEEAVQRGVDVRIMVPSDDATDSAIVQHASHHHFGTLLKRGVKIWEYERTLLHQKVIVVDGVWSCVGSTNFDERSFELNDEVSVGILDPAIATQLRTAFADDLRHAKKMDFESWKNRSWWHKTVDGVAYLGRSQL
ncbi:MAG TPA: cardiolipin synthase [Thermoanaerobaculia bacterium]|nr:cardiolipin synthase [Thermoanaerobaculia bacterium]